MVNSPCRLTRTFTLTCVEIQKFSLGNCAFYLLICMITEWSNIDNASHEIPYLLALSFRPRVDILNGVVTNDGVRENGWLGVLGLEGEGLPPEERQHL